MKRTGLLLITLGISAPVSCESAYEKAAHAIENQNFQLLDEAFSSQESISPQQREQLVKKAQKICQTRARNSSSKKDLALLTIGSILACLPAWKIIFDQLPILRYPEQGHSFKDPDQPNWHTHRQLYTSELIDIEKSLCTNLLLSICGAGLAYKGYTCTFAQRALNKANLILAEVKAYQSSN